MRIKSKDCKSKEEVLELENAIERNLSKTKYVDTYEDMSDYVSEAYDQINNLTRVLTNILKDMPLDKINKYLDTNFEEVE